MNPRTVARHTEIANRIRTHLFIISPNNSGSTFLQSALATSEKTWNLRGEGQNTFGFCGPNPDRRRRLIPGPFWAAKQQWIDYHLDQSHYDWPLTRKAWYLQAFAKNEALAEVFVEKSPPFLLQVDTLLAHFPEARFLFLVRNPYAVAESILRRSAVLSQFTSLPDSPVSPEEIHELAAAHLVACLQYQQENRVRYSSIGIHFTYEDMCRTPYEVASKIQSLVPALDDLRLDQRIAVKGRYDEPLRDMNRQHIERLAPTDIELLNAVFQPHEKLLNAFGYEIMQAG